MPVSQRRLRWLIKPTLIALNGIVGLLLVATFALIYLERNWVTPRFAEPKEAFASGTIGTELMPLPVAITLPRLASHHFLPGGPSNGNWIEQFGFLPNADDSNGLPIGFAVSRYRPQSGAPSPVPFVGFSCALCHTTAIRPIGATAQTKVVTGPGSVSLNLFAWVDALQAALIERVALIEEGARSPPPYRVSAEAIFDKYRDITGSSLGMAEQLMVSLWLRQFRQRIEDGLPRFDEPFGHGKSRMPTVTPTGPTRTLPFRTLIRTVLNRPGNGMTVYTKIAAVFNQSLRPRAQFDGSIADLDARSSIAALAAGATVTNMALPEIAHNIKQASKYTETLSAPAFEELFPGTVVATTDILARGKDVYRTHCFACHGDRTGDAWKPGPRTNTIIPITEIGTDPDRVTFRHYGELPGRIHNLFEPGHPFYFDRDKIFPLPGKEDDKASRGYVAGPIDGAYLRAPFLHNASVMTLSELINLEPRRSVFYRGRNRYDPQRAGFVSPASADRNHYFRFDTTVRGNANTGHDYPWTFNDPERSEEDLRALLAYLKTL